MEIREYVELRLPEGIAKLQDDEALDGNEGPEVVGAAIAVQLDRLLLPNTDVSVLGEFVKSYIADIVAHDLITNLLDWTLWKTRRQDSMGSPPGVGNFGGEQSSNYDRVAALQQLQGIIGTRLDRDLIDFQSLAVNVLRTTGSSIKVGIGIRAPYSDWKTLDPGRFVPAWLPDVGAPGGLYSKWGVIVAQDTLVVEGGTVRSP